MELKWINKAYKDLVRIYETLLASNMKQAVRTLQAIMEMQNNLLVNPYIGERLREFYPRDVRKVDIGFYELRYEIQESAIFILQLIQLHYRTKSENMQSEL